MKPYLQPFNELERLLAIRKKICARFDRPVVWFVDDLEIDLVDFVFDRYTEWVSRAVYHRINNVYRGLRGGIYR